MRPSVFVLTCLQSASGILMRQVAILLIRFYRYFISPMFASHCRFYPSCSSYAVDAYTHFGFFKGSYYTFRRLLRCHPGHPGGYDPLIKHHDCSCDHQVNGANPPSSQSPNS